MKKKLHNYLWASMLALVFSTALSAQSPEMRNGFVFKPIFVNYDEPLDRTFNSFTDNTRGIELGYIRNLNKFFNLAFPLKMGTADIPIGNGDFDNSNLFLSLDGLIQLGLFRGDYIVAPYLLTGIGATYLDRSFGDNEINPHIPIGAGLNVKLTKHLYIQLQYEYRYAFEDDREHDHVGLGLAWLMGGSPPPPDRDGDGVTDDMDSCPDVAGIAALKGCPDKDGDGITDKSDTCPDVAGLAKYNGCPDTDEDGIIDSEDDCPEEVGPASNKGCPIKDSDNDGLMDDVDDCPEEAGPKSNNGCPVKDSDGDGVPDDRDDCPNDAGIAKYNGCPDGDGDGVMDKDDKCPTTKGTIANNGCPEIKKEDKEVLKFAMKAVQFNTAQATLKTVSTSVLDEVADIMKKYPDYSLAISGHTDSVGSAGSNQLLSERRAKTCFDYLVTKGITPTRMSYVGYGETQPIADNKFKAGRDTNRRVEFNIYLK